jgi:DNA-binding FadR family transcriptional regulator
MAGEATVESAEGRGRSNTELFAMAREVVFAPIVGQSLVDLTVKRLLEIVSLGVLEVGEMLPSEPVLASRLGVSPSTLREALVVLRRGGVLATKRGRGGGTVVIRALAPPPAAEARRRLAARSLEELRDLGDFRLAIAGQVAALAAERAAPSEVEVLQALADTMAATDSLGTYRRSDAQMHIGIASSARSSRLTAAETAVHVELGDYLSLVARTAAPLRLANDQHQRILDAIRRRDVDTAREASEEHARATTALLIEARSELADVEAERTVDYFAGIRPYGSELGSTPLTLESPEPPARAKRRRRAPQ